MPVFAKPVISSSGRVPAKALGANRHSSHEEEGHGLEQDPENASPNIIPASDQPIAGERLVDVEQKIGLADPAAVSSPLTVKPLPAPDDQHQDDNKLKVFVRMRPVRTSDKAPTGDQLCVQKVSSTSLRYLGDRQASTSPRGSADKFFKFDGVMGWRATQEQVFKAYGQPGSGKSFTMEGSQLPTATGSIPRRSPRPSSATPSNSPESQPLGGVLRGLIPRTFEKLFQDIHQSEDQGRYMVYASYLSICSDRVFDLLASPSRPTLLQTDDANDDVIGDGATEEIVSSAEDAMKLFQRATVNRSRTINASNPASLDCHSVLTLRVRRMPPKTPPSKTASLASAAVTPEGASSFVAAAAATAAAAAAAAAGVNSVASGFVSDSLMGITEDAEGGGAEDEAEGRSSYLRFIEIAGRGLAHDVGGLHLLSRVLGQGVDGQSLGVLQKASDDAAIGQAHAQPPAAQCSDRFAHTSNLSLLLQDALNGSTRTSLVATISPSAACATATHDTLRLAHLTKTLHPSTAASRALAHSMATMQSLPGAPHSSMHASECSEASSQECSEVSCMHSEGSSAAADSAEDSEVTSASVSPRMADMGLPLGIAPDEPPSDHPNCLRELPLNPTHPGTSNRVLEPSGMFLHAQDQDISLPKASALSALVPPASRVSTGGTAARSPLGTCAPLLATSHSLPKTSSSMCVTSTNSADDHASRGGPSHGKFVDLIMHGSHEFPPPPPSSGLPLLPSTLALFRPPAAEASTQEASCMHACVEASQDSLLSDIMSESMISIEPQPSPSPRVLTEHTALIPASALRASMHDAVEQTCVPDMQLTEHSLKQCMLSCTDAWDENSRRVPEEAHTAVHSAVSSRLRNKEQSRLGGADPRMHERHARMRFDSGGCVESLKAVVSTSASARMHSHGKGEYQKIARAAVPACKEDEHESESLIENGTSDAQVEAHCVHGNNKKGTNADAAFSAPVTIPHAVNNLSSSSQQVEAVMPAEHALEVQANASERLCHALKSKGPSAPNGEESCILAWRSILPVSAMPSIESSRDSLARIAVVTGDGGASLHVKLPEDSNRHALPTPDASRSISPSSQESNADDVENEAQVCVEGSAMETSTASATHACDKAAVVSQHASQEHLHGQTKTAIASLAMHINGCKSTYAAANAEHPPPVPSDQQRVVASQTEEAMHADAADLSAPQPQSCAVRSTNEDADGAVLSQYVAYAVVSAEKCVKAFTAHSAAAMPAVEQVPVSLPATSYCAQDGRIVHGANAAERELAALQLKAQTQAAGDAMHDPHAYMDDQDDFMMLPMPPRPSEVLPRPQAALPPLVPPRPESRKLQVPLPFVPLVVGSSDGGGSSRTLTPQGGSPKVGLVPSLDCALQSALRAQSYLVEAPCTEPGSWGAHSRAPGDAAPAEPLMNSPQKFAVPPLNVDAVYHEDSLASATCSELYGDSYEHSYGDSSALPLPAMRSNESVSCEYSYTHDTACTTCMESSSHGSGCTTCIARAHEAIEQNVVSSSLVVNGGVDVPSTSRQMQCMAAAFAAHQQRSSPLVTQAKPPCMHGAHAHNCESGVPQAYFIPPYTAEDFMCIMHAVATGNPSAAAQELKPGDIQRPAPLTNQTDHVVTQALTQQTVATRQSAMEGAPTPHVASGVTTEGAYWEPEASGCGAPQPHVATRVQASGDPTTHSSLELHEASVASRIAALGREIEACDLQGRCVVQCEDSLIDSVHSQWVTHATNPYSSHSNSSCTADSSSADALYADESQSPPRQDLSGMNQSPVHGLQATQAPSEFQYTSEDAQKAMHRAATLEAQVRRLKSDHEKEMAEAIKRAKNDAARAHNAQIMQLRRDALQTYQDDMAPINKSNIQEINTLKAEISRLQQQAADKDAAREESEAALSQEMEELCGQISRAAKAASDDRLAAEKQIAELQSLLHSARAQTAEARAQTAEARHDASTNQQQLKAKHADVSAFRAPESPAGSWKAYDIDTSSSSLIPSSPLPHTAPSCSAPEASKDQNLPEVTTTTSDTPEATSIPLQPIVEGNDQQPEDDVPGASGLARFRSMVGGRAAPIDAVQKEEEKVPEEPVEQQLRNVQRTLQSVEHENLQLQQTLKLLMQAITEGMSLQELCSLMSGPWRRAPLINVGPLPLGAPSATAALQFTGIPLVPAQLDSCTWALRPVSADTQVYCMSGGSTTIRGGTLTLPEGSVLLLQDCEDVKLQGWTVSGGTVVALGSKCTVTLDSCTLRTTTVATGGATLAISNCTHSNTPVAMIAAALYTTLTCAHCTVTNCSQAALAIGKASATFQNLEASGTFLGAAIEARGVGTAVSVRGANIRGGSEVPKTGLEPKSLPKAAAAFSTPTDGALACCGAKITMHDTAIERVAIGVRATNPQSAVFLIDCDVRTACMALAHASDGAQLNATGSNFETAAVGGGGVVSTGHNSIVTLSQCLVSDTCSSAVTVLDSGAADLTDCVLAGSRNGAGVDVRGKGSQLKAKTCSVRYNSTEGVRVSDAAQATLQRVTCSGNAAHGFAVLSGALLEASEVTSATDGHHALFAHGKGTKVQLHDSTLQHATMSAACIESHAGAVLRNCVLEHSKASHGVAASGSALLSMRKCMLHRNKGNGLSLTASSQAEIANSHFEQNGTHGISVSDTCKLEAEGVRIHSEAANGISMTGLHASATLMKCTVTDCAWSGVALGGGSTLEATGCEFSGARECMGVQIEGSGTNAALNDTKVARNKGSGVSVTAGASARLVGCKGSGNGKSAFVATGGARLSAGRCTSTADGQGGVVVGGVGTQATIEHTTVTRSSCSGMHIQGGATATLKSCEVAASAENGVSVQGHGTEAFLTSCKLMGNKGAGTSVRDNASASLHSCTTHANHASAITVLKHGAAWLDRCRTSSESVNMHDTSGKLQYAQHALPPCVAERTALMLIKVLAVLLLFTMTGCVGVLSGLLPPGVATGVL